MSAQKEQAKKNVSLTESSKVDDSKFNNISQSIDDNKTIVKFNTILIGNMSVGKTSIMKRLLMNRFEEKYTCSINVDFKVKQFKIDKETTVELCLWDTCGSEKYRALTQSFYKKAQGVIAVFDITDKISFVHLECWLDDLSKCASKKPVIFIVGNKLDLELQRTVSETEIKEYAQSKKIEYMEVSAKSGINIQLLFEQLASKLVKERENIVVEEDKVTNVEVQKDKGRCC